MQDRAAVAHYIETLVNLVTVRDIAELDTRFPGFAEAVAAKPRSPKCFEFWIPRQASVSDVDSENHSKEEVECLH